VFNPWRRRQAFFSSDGVGGFWFGIGV
jgi:hypothetical protein